MEKTNFSMMDPFFSIIDILTYFFHVYSSLLEDVVAPGFYLEINWHGIQLATCSLILIDTLEKDRK